MLSKFFESSSRIRTLRDGTTGDMFEGFARALSEAGYSMWTARLHIRAAEHLVYWSNRHDVAICEVNDESFARFGRHVPRCRCPRYSHAYPIKVLHGARVFVDYLRDARIITGLRATASIQEPVLLSEFGRWMRQQRGTADATLYNYSIHIRDLLKELGEEPRAWTAHALRAFVLEKHRASGWAAKKCTTALRVFLRFLITEGRCAVGLGGAIPTLAHWRLATLPRFFQPEDVERIIASCDGASAVGRRDRAILLLLARLGLRAGDVVRLRLSDIDWKGASIHVSGKGRRDALLPLTREVGQTIVAYLRRGRPKTKADTVFVRARAPFRALASHCAVSVIVDRALNRAGVARPSRGAAHLLRHSIAASMLRHGASLQEISALLRHRSIATTQIYAKVDITALKAIAQPWPEVHQC